jgi:hypothetical protein
MGPPENPTSHPEKQQPGRRKRLALRARARRCLLKGCEQRFHPRQARQRYCGERCREEARSWSRWKAQQRYRETAAGQQKRHSQSRRYRERVKSRKPAEPKAVSEVARVISTEPFFRSLVRPAGLLRKLRAPAAISFAALLLAGLPARHGTRLGAGAALERGARLNPDILIHRRRRPYIQPVDATGASPTRPAVGAPAGAPSGAAAAVIGVAGRLRPANTHRGGGGRRTGGPLRGYRRP